MSHTSFQQSLSIDTADPIKRVLTRRRRFPGRKVLVEEPNETLLLSVKFAIGMTGFMSALELAHMAFLHTWNAEIFATIPGLSGTVIGLFVGQKTSRKENLGQQITRKGSKTGIIQARQTTPFCPLV